MPEARRPQASERPGAEEAAEDRHHADPDHPLGGFGRGDLEHHHEERDQPQGQGDAARLGQPGQTAGNDAARIAEELDPARLLDSRRHRRQRDRTRVHLQGPGERLPRLGGSPLAQQPVRRFGDPGADVEGQERRQQPDREHAAPADIGGGVGAEQRAQQKARRQHRRRQPGKPAALCRRDEFLDQRDVDRVEAGRAETDQEAPEDEIDPRPVRGYRHRPGGDRDVEHGQDHHLAPADLVGQPAVEQRAERGNDTRSEQDQTRLAIGQVPVFDDIGQDEADQQKVEEIEHVAERRRQRDLPLVRRQLGLPFEQFEHGVLPLVSVLRHRPRRGGGRLRTRNTFNVSKNQCHRQHRRPAPHTRLTRPFSGRQAGRRRSATTRPASCASPPASAASGARRTAHGLAVLGFAGDDGPGAGGRPLRKRVPPVFLKK